MAKHNQIGKIGENIAAKWLITRGYTILERNYLKKWGEIDIVAHETDRVHFIEVKTVSHETKAELEDAISRGTWRPEEKVHNTKLLRLGRVVETWIAEHRVFEDWQIDVLAVRIVPSLKYARVSFIENVILE